jgi:hypothetical protein
MSDPNMQAAMAVWASRSIPARLNVKETARLLGFADHDIQILMAARKLTPLGDPAANAPKWFAAIEVIRLAMDEEWLNKATKEVGKYWRHKRERSGTSPCNRHRIASATRESDRGEVSPNFSPESSPSWQRVGSEEECRAISERT